MEKWNVKAVLVLLTVLVAACGAKKVRLDESNQITKNGIAVTAAWVKNKDKKFDVELEITNQSAGPIIINVADMSCYRGASQGELKGPRTIRLGAGQKRSFKMACDLKEKASGDYKIAIAEVFANPGGDGKTRGEVVARDIQWVAH